MPVQQWYVVTNTVVVSCSRAGCAGGWVGGDTHAMSLPHAGGHPITSTTPHETANVLPYYEYMRRTKNGAMYVFVS